ncbi:Similar to S.cerevisiae protein TOS3 (Protein kinase) [Malassezia sympodialis ATCC 42132]|uniref:Similar to S.cerevisiae protein TOS3 (Protein kinase) n=2 Tax=Malassezia sympodialis (strain ATCC 42132) TaxID=1230383 RepID=A0A1M8A4I0_MALS4|nr:Similar to S.cerevisiae protein TOS3 (Protein kinase) [Malassezia sympodialis ATCC 42132]
MSVRQVRTLRVTAHPRTGQRMINDYVVDGDLGRGSFGNVKLAHDDRTGECVAVKIVQREAPRRLGVPYTPRQTDERLVREIQAMSRCRHPHVVQLYEVIDDPNSRRLFLILEYMPGGALVWQDALQRPALSFNDARYILRGVAEGLASLHACGVIHRDIKPANILLSEDGVPKISDFGCAYVRAGRGSADDLSSATDPLLARTFGTPSFFAPELCRDAAQGPPVTKAIDVWALGATLYCLLFGRPPFWADTEYLLLESIMHDDFALPATMGIDGRPIGPRAPRWPPVHADRGADAPAPAPVPAPRSDEAEITAHLLDRLLEKDPRSRLTLDEALLHPWLAAGPPSRASSDERITLQRTASGRSVAQPKLGDSSSRRAPSAMLPLHSIPTT